MPLALSEAVRSETGQTWLIGGRVQGVGFRPFVCVMANELGVRGSVRNRGGQVEIVAIGDRASVELLLLRLLAEHPPIARPELITTRSCIAAEDSGFRILPSGCGEPGGAVLPDEPTCDACLTEMADPKARRYRYPFIACTQCGPRYTTIASPPFDRATTGMAGFPLCDLCRAEYEQPENRRFHAQLIACATCGPTLSFRDGSENIRGNEPALARTIETLRTGAIVAVRGIGGYHLFCDATHHAAINRLRDRKRRPTKPLAVMFPRTGRDSLDQLRLHCAIDAEAARSLRSREKPIVLVPLHANSTLSSALAPGLGELGALMPYSPLHELLLSGFGRPLVATSGNLGGEPVLTEPAEAEALLASIADAFLHHDRPILNPADDGIVRIISGRARAFRLGRGSAPLSISPQRPLTKPVLALGGQMKVTLALGFGTRVVISPHLGDLDSPRGLDRLEATAETLQRLHGVRVQTLVCDAHGGYTGTRWAAGQDLLPVLRISHHHAHAAAVAGEFRQERRWLCFTWDGSGLGEDGRLWGGEALLGQPGAWTRVGTFRSFAPLGGDKAAREPWRSAAALAWEMGLDWRALGVDISLARAAWQQRLNCPLTSSVGRLFDAASAFLNLTPHTSYEGEGPMAVEALATEADNAAALPLSERTDGVLEADWEPLVHSLLNARVTPGRRSATMHACLALTLVSQAIAIKKRHGPFAVGLAGGVFQNRRLASLSLRGLKEAGFRAYLPLRIPCNDAGLSFGQVTEAAARQ
jgi:hydrogenase maturation protein HypF